MRFIVNVNIQNISAAFRTLIKVISFNVLVCRVKICADRDLPKNTDFSF